ncbi:probable NADH dehydrogenase [ubiquinone] 1 alpha subcomplex subunit 12 [Galendromus occidentalis]|uniref:NADH dehydrogenase [ubiquinone] 1 alpha subcomplex subunit 12 n=1 Tax=Galendromus occidentalis TaxID=34638 RepID=A0AAJ6QPU9_9ACAR|nr:probable NADH dehydrogenase [ubiquinone] 1 alpha subcomplex subunit 12 [Galendromus occidentalis]
MIIDKVHKTLRVIQENGGWLNSLLKLYRYDTLKSGRLVGTDDYGNRYYENKEYFMGRDRWVEYADKVRLDYDGSQIPAEWYGWMHHKTDIPPTLRPPPKYKWLAQHTENMTGTSRQYVPYDTVPPKIQPWIPGKK